MNNYTIYAADLGGTLISGCADQALDAGLTHSIIHGDGLAFPQHIAPMSQEPVIPFSSLDIKALLDKLGSGGVAWVVDAPTSFFAQKMSATGRSADSDHLKMTVNKGVVIPLQLTAGQGEGNEARLSAQCIPLWDGTNAPIVLALASLAGSPSVARVYAAGPAKINNVAIGTIQSLSVAFNLNVRRIQGDGEGWPRDVVMATMAPVITATTTEVAWLNTLGLVGTAAAANTVFYLTRLKGSDQSMRYADNEAEHIAITAQGRIAVSGLAGDDPQVATIELRARSVSGAVPISIDTAAAIT